MKTRICCHGRNSRTSVPMIGVRPMPPPTQTLKPISPASFFTQLQADVVPADRGAVFGRAGDGDLELARQEGELRVQRAPLAQDLAVGPRVDDLVGRDAGECVAGDVADAVAAGLDAVHVDLGQQVHHVGALGERDPVELQVLARREVAVAARRNSRAMRPAAQLLRAAARRRAPRRAASAHGAARTSRSAGAAGGTPRRRGWPARLRSSWSRYCAARWCTKLAVESVYWYIVVSGSVDHLQPGRHERRCRAARARAARAGGG